jgi:glycosyltransferase involved in cell wall biosynthesis
MEDRRRRGLLVQLPLTGAGRLDRAATVAQADLVHCLTPEASPRGSVGAARIVTCHHIDSDRSPNEWHGAQSSVSLDPRHFLRADRIIAASRATAQELIARLDVPRSKIEVVYNSVDQAKWRPEAHPEDAARLAALGAQRHRYFLCVGAASERKNADGMLRGLARARDMLPGADLRMIWVGQQGKYEEEDARACAKRLRIERAVHFTGWVDDADLAALYRHAVALSFVSRREGFGFPVLEAMASGCPVLTSTSSSLGEIAADAAITVEPEDTAAIADALVLLWESPANRADLRQRGSQRVQAFSPSKFREGTLSAYRHAVQTLAR